VCEREVLEEIMARSIPTGYKEKEILTMRVKTLMGNGPK